MFLLHDNDDAYSRDPNPARCLKERCDHKMKMIFFTLAALLTAPLASAEDPEPGPFGADAIFVHPFAGPAASDTIRGVISVAPIQIDTVFSKLDLFSADATVSASIATGQMELSRFRATALRMSF